MPTLRSSNYLQLLAERFPALANSAPGNIQEPLLPELRNLIVVKNFNEHELVKPAVDWREVFLWREDTREAKLVNDIARGLDKDDVINLQFTRLDLLYSSAPSADSLLVVPLGRLKLYRYVFMYIMYRNTFS